MDVSKNTALERLYCFNNQLTCLDVSKNTKLTGLSCENTQLTSLDVSKNTALERLHCYNNQLTSLDVSKNTALELLYCYNNQLTSLDVSKNTTLKYLNCRENPALAILWMKRGQSISSFTYDSSITTIKYVDDFEQFEAVDLGLSVKWASCNVGANAPEEYGDYFAWGEVEPKKTDYSWSTYKYANGAENTLTKYCGQTACGNNGFTDALTTLEMTDDAARANWGGSWRMPTKEEFEELKSNCDWVWTTQQNGVSGYKFTARNGSGNSIFLPAAGWCYGGFRVLGGGYGYYWSSSLLTDYPGGAWGLYVDSDYADAYSDYGRYGGLSVRPVCD